MGKDLGMIWFGWLGIDMVKLWWIALRIWLLGAIFFGPRFIFFCAFCAF